MRIASDISCTKNQSKHFILNIFSFFENRAVYEIMWENIVERGKRQMTIWRMRIACWVPKGTDTHSDYIILIAFPQQYWLRESAPVYRSAYIVGDIASACTQ